MHIVYVTGRFAEDTKEILQGMPNYVYKIAATMARLGHQVTIVMSGKKKRVWNYKGIPVYSIRTPETVIMRNKAADAILKPILRDIEFNKALKLVNENKEITIVQYIGWFGDGVLYNRKYPSVLRLSTYLKYQLSSVYPRWYLEITSFYERMAAKNFNGILVPSKAIGDYYAKEVKRNVTIMETPFEYELTGKEDFSLYDRKLSNTKYFLFFGRISIDKGVGTIARCIENILINNPNYIFCFAGAVGQINGTSAIHFLKKSAGTQKNRVVYLGNLKHEQLYPVIRNAECIIMPSLMDNLPNACLEAMYLNGIVIGTRGASFDEIFSDGRGGFLIDIDDSEMLLEKINYVVHMDEHAKTQMRLEAKKILSRYSYIRVGRKMEKYYQYINRYAGKKCTNNE